MRPTRAIGPALGASLVLLAAACGDDGDTADTGVDPYGESSSQTPAETTSETPTAKPVEPVDFGDEPAVKASYERAALRASSEDELITMVPSILPDGWTTVGGGYRSDPQWWRMEFTAPSGEVVLDQLPGTSDDVLADRPGLTAVDDVDLSDWGTGAWSAWDHGGASVLAYDLKGSTVVLQGPDLETVRGLAESLLPADEAGEQEG
jgi:hypothetical protein